MTVTMADIKAMKDDWLTPATVGSAMHMDPGRLIWYAKNGQLPFATRISGNRVLISRQSFLKCYGHMEEEKEQDNRLKGYRTEKTTMGHKIRVMMSREEIRERRIFHALMVILPTGMVWLFALAGGMLT